MRTLLSSYLPQAILHAITERNERFWLLSALWCLASSAGKALIVSGGCVLVMPPVRFEHTDDEHTSCLY